MKKYAVKVGFVGGDRSEVLYCKCYTIEAETEEAARAFVRNGLSIAEFQNFIIVEVMELER